MTRKRFVRLMMAKGMQQNKAAEFAASVGAYGSYEALFSIMTYQYSFKMCGVAYRRFAEAAGDATRAMLALTEQTLAAEKFRTAAGVGFTGFLWQGGSTAEALKILESAAALEE